MASLRKITKRFLIILNVIVIVLFLLSCTNGFLHPEKWWPVSILGLLFPLFLLLLLVFFIGWVISLSWRSALVCILALAAGWTNINRFLAFNLHHSFFAEKPNHSFRVLTWNVRRWDEFINKKAGSSGHRDQMMAFLAQQDADILCFQEFFESHNPKELASNIPYIQQQLHFPYYYFSHDYRRYDGQFESGVVIFSKFPVTGSLIMKYSGPDSTKASESLIAVDLDIHGKTIRVFTTHLQSVLFRNNDFRNLEIIKNVDDSLVAASMSIVKKLKRAYGLRGYQADQLREQIDKSPYPVIVCGDFNDVPNSYAYVHIRGRLQDAYIQKGLGIGRTYTRVSPTLRIDYILADQQFAILQCKNFPLPFSDHHPVVADLELP